MINQDLEQENEYFNRKMYFRTVFESYNIKWEIGNLTEYWYGTEAEHTIELKKYLDKGLKVFRIVKTKDKPFMYDYKSVKPDHEELKRRRNFTGIQQKENLIKQEQKRYLKSGY